MTHPFDIHAGGKEIHPPADFRWPDNEKSAVVFRMAYEWWSDGAWPGIGPMGNPLKGGVPDINAVGWAEYGHRRGVERVLEIFERHKRQGRLSYVCGIMAKRYPEEVKHIASLRHDIVAAFLCNHAIPALLDEKQELDNIKRTTDLIANVIESST
jgi:peptidoglycan/xylan/chitin deacetylase (PgdA/CDA1 family)